MNDTIALAKQRRFSKDRSLRFSFPSYLFACLLVRSLYCTPSAEATAGKTRAAGKRSAWPLCVTKQTPCTLFCNSAHLSTCLACACAPLTVVFTVALSLSLSLLRSYPVIESENKNKNKNE